MAAESPLISTFQCPVNVPQAALRSFSATPGPDPQQTPTHIESGHWNAP